MHIEEIKKTIKEEEVVVDVVCDVCNKNLTETLYNFNKKGYLEIITSHRDWGNDSGDSLEFFQVCDDCLEKFIIQKIKESSKTSGEIEIKREFFIKRDII